MDKINALLEKAPFAVKPKMIAWKIYNKLEPFNRFKISYNGHTTLCVGGKMQYQDRIFIEQDMFKLYSPSILQDENDVFTIRRILWDDSENLMRLKRADGTEMYIYCYKVEDKFRQSFDLAAESLVDLTDSRLIDYELSKEVDGRNYYILDVFRARSTKNLKKLVNYLANALRAWEFSDRTLTVAFEFIDELGNAETKTPTQVRFTLWDLILDEPVGKNW